MENITDEGMPEYDIFRTLDTYKLGPETTGSETYCKSKASSDDPMAFFGHALEAIVFLNLDRLEDQEYVDNKTYHLMNSGDFKATPVAMSKGKYILGNHEIGVYTLKYKIEGFVNDELKNLIGPQINFKRENIDSGEVSGYVTFTFSTNTVAAAWVLASKYELDIQGGYPYIEEHKNVLSINGYNLP